MEMLLSVGILAMLAALSLPVYQSFYNRNELDITAQNLAGALRRAQTYARAGHNDNQWGVEIQPTAITVFQGGTFAGRDTSYDEVSAISAGTTVGGLSEVLFAKLSGTPVSTGSVTLTSANNETRTVTINAQGMVSY